MKKEVHKSNQRGTSELGWLHSKFSFSFANYHNPKRMNFGALRVFNDDIVEPGFGFGTHHHDNMEIISIPTQGELAHKDNLGTQEIVGVGDVQVMSAGSGVEHSELNNSKANQVKFFQIWIETKYEGIKPRHDKKFFNLQQNILELVVSGEKSDGRLYISQDAKIYLGKIDKNKKINYDIKSGNGVFVFLVEGNITVNKNKLNQRDSIEISETEQINIKTNKNSYFILIEVPMS